MEREGDEGRVFAGSQRAKGSNLWILDVVRNSVSPCSRAAACQGAAF